MQQEIIKFTRQKDLKFIRDLGQGACGRTVLLYDDVINETFVCKKYAPIYDELKEDLWSNFKQEIKLLHLLNHQNIVRFFNYYLYPTKLTGYILMEYVEGNDIEKYLRDYPEKINQIFLQAIEGFAHLEQNNILHRDIRPLNLLVSNDGILKIIDFGFGKHTNHDKGYTKSITLNWLYEKPKEFESGIYNYSTEIYFLGKLFEKIISDNQIESFSYRKILSRMCNYDIPERLNSFNLIRNEILSGEFSEISFDFHERAAYRAFSDAIIDSIATVDYKAKFIDNPDDIQRKIENHYKYTMLEEKVATNQLVSKCLISGEFSFYKNRYIKVQVIKNFLNLLKKSSKEKKNIIIGNLQTRLESIEKDYTDQEYDDIPF